MNLNLNSNLIPLRNGIILVPNNPEKQLGSQNFLRISCSLSKDLRSGMKRPNSVQGSTAKESEKVPGSAGFYANAVNIRE